MEAPEGSAPIMVRSVDHASGRPGQYFNFDLQAMNAVLNTVLGRGLLIDERLPVRNLRTGEERFAMFKPFANGGEYGDAHGRWADDSRGGQWSTGDRFVVLLGVRKWLLVMSSDSPRGPIGQYFSFSREQVEACLGRLLVDGEKLEGRKIRMNAPLEPPCDQVTLKTRPIGQVGNAHGRYSINAGAGQWATGDVIELTELA